MAKSFSTPVRERRSKPWCPTLVAVVWTGLGSAGASRDAPTPEASQTTATAIAAISEGIEATTNYRGAREAGTRIGQPGVTLLWSESFSCGLRGFYVRLRVDSGRHGYASDGG